MEINEIKNLSTALDIAGYVAIVCIMGLLYAAYRYLKSLDEINTNECEKCGGANRYECEYYGCKRNTDL